MLSQFSDDPLAESERWHPCIPSDGSDKQPAKTDSQESHGFALLPHLKVSIAFCRWRKSYVGETAKSMEAMEQMEQRLPSVQLGFCCAGVPLQPTPADCLPRSMGQRELQVRLHFDVRRCRGAGAVRNHPRRIRNITGRRRHVRRLCSPPRPQDLDLRRKRLRKQCVLAWNC